jgi:class 3 adenylate cyclase
LQQRRLFATIATRTRRRFRCTAAPGQILVSHAAEALLEGEHHELDIRDLGERTLPTRNRPAHVFEEADRHERRTFGTE